MQSPPTDNLHYLGSEKIRFEKQWYHFWYLLENDIHFSEPMHYDDYTVFSYTQNELRKFITVT